MDNPRRPPQPQRQTLNPRHIDPRDTNALVTAARGAVPRAPVQTISLQPARPNAPAPQNSVAQNNGPQRPAPQNIGPQPLPQNRGPQPALQNRGPQLGPRGNGPQPVIQNASPRPAPQGIPPQQAMQYQAGQNNVPRPGPNPYARNAQILQPVQAPRPLPTQARPMPQQPAGQTPARGPQPPRAPMPAPQGHARPAGGKAPTKVEDLMLVIRQLCDLLTKENTVLKRHRTGEVKTFTERKEHLARLYQGHMNAVHRDKSLLKDLDAGRRAALTQQAMRLGDLMQENAALLKGNIQSINLFFKAVTDAVRERQERTSAAYSRRGAMNGYIAKRSLAVSFNQTM